MVKVIEASGFGPIEGSNYGTPLSPYGPGDHPVWEMPKDGCYQSMFACISFM
jgi:hypothetical protein